MQHLTVSTFDIPSDYLNARKEKMDDISEKCYAFQILAVWYHCSVIIPHVTAMYNTDNPLVMHTQIRPWVCSYAYGDFLS